MDLEKSDFPGAAVTLGGGKLELRCLLHRLFLLKFCSDEVYLFVLCLARTAD